MATAKTVNELLEAIEKVIKDGATADLHPMERLANASSGLEALQELREKVALIRFY